jgi:hypothetical protein
MIMIKLTDGKILQKIDFTIVNTKNQLLLFNKIQKLF